MREELSKLIGILEEQRAMQAALVELSERKVKAITAGDSSALQGIVEEEKGVLTQLKAVEKRQSQCVGRLAALLGVPVESVRMSLILEKAEGEQREKLTQLREELSALVEKQVTLNETNMKLLQMNMDYMQFLINASSNQKVGTTYGNGGDLQKTSGGANRLLDRKV